MSFDVPTTEPVKFTAGDSVSWTKSLADYPATTWTLSYSFVSSAVQFTESTSAASGTDHLVTITAADSALITAGIYNWQSYVTSGSERHQVGAGTVEVLTNFATSTGGFDGRSHVKKTLDAIEAVIESRATTDQASMSIAGRSISRVPYSELLELHSKYKGLYAQEIKAERLAAGLGVSSKVRVRFK